jgi:hypothetical protein
VLALTVPLAGTLQLELHPLKVVAFGNLSHLLGHLLRVNVNREFLDLVDALLVAGDCLVNQLVGYGRPSL